MTLHRYARHACAMVALASACGPARADFDCTDIWGSHYRLVQVAATAVLACHPLTEQPAATFERDFLLRPLAAGGGTLALLEIRPGLQGGMWLDEGPRRARSWYPQAPDAALSAMIAAAARAHGHDVRLMQAIIGIESGFNPNAVSPRGAIGLMQVMPSTAAGLGLADPRHALLDPRTNLDVGARYLRKLVDLFPGRIDLAVAAYNAGEQSVMRNGWRVPPYRETQDYVRDVLALYNGR
jgi:soluble lytic murein transglycosylase-like protein